VLGLGQQAQVRWQLWVGPGVVVVVLMAVQVVGDPAAVAAAVWPPLLAFCPYDVYP
jgi:hypothetical protein